METNFGKAIEICHACEFRQRPCNGPCPCLIDGMDIIQHAEELKCPKNKFVDLSISGISKRTGKIIIPRTPCRTCGGGKINQ
jgi:hypothetical protein